MRKPDKASQRYNPSACAQACMPVGDYVYDLERYVQYLEHVIKSFRHEKSTAYPMGCWCQACQNNPMVHEHSRSCQDAQKVMAQVDDDDDES